MNTHVNRALAGLAIVATLALGAITGTAAAHADDTITVELPVCELEDGSDLIEGHCVWIDPDTGDAYINAAPAR